MADKIRIGALISGGGTNLQAIIDACESGGIDGDMVFVGSDNPEAKGLARSRHHGIPSFVVDYGAIIREYKINHAATRIPTDFDLPEILSKQSLFSSRRIPGNAEDLFFQPRHGGGAASRKNECLLLRPSGAGGFYEKPDALLHRPGKRSTRHCPGS